MYLEEQDQSIAARLSSGENARASGSTRITKLKTAVPFSQHALYQTLVHRSPNSKRNLGLFGWRKISLGEAFHAKESRPDVGGCARHSLRSPVLFVFTTGAQGVIRQVFSGVTFLCLLCSFA